MSLSICQSGWKEIRNDFRLFIACCVQTPPPLSPNFSEGSGASVHRLGDSLSPLGDHNKDLGAASQTLLTWVKLRIQRRQNVMPSRFYRARISLSLPFQTPATQTMTCLAVKCLKQVKKCETKLLTTPFDAYTTSHETSFALFLNLNHQTSLPALLHCVGVIRYPTFLGVPSSRDRGFNMADGEKGRRWPKTGERFSMGSGMGGEVVAILPTSNFYLWAIDLHNHTEK